MGTEKDSTGKVTFEEAIDRAGFGLYSYLLTALSGLIIVASVCTIFASTIIIPVSACELNTTNAQQGMLAAAPMVGSILGGIIWGYLADTKGRRKMLIVALTCAAIVNIVASISVNWIMLMLLWFVSALSASGMYSMSMTLLSESVPMSRRNLVMLLVSSIFLLSQGIMAVFAIPIIPLTFSYYVSGLDIYWNSWRTLLVVYSIPSLLSAFLLLFVQESPKFIFTKGDESTSLKILYTIHRCNNKRGEVLEVTGILQDPQAKGVDPEQNKLLPLFKKPLIKYTIIMTALSIFQQVGAFLIWLPTIANQFMSILETGEGTDQNLCGIIGISLGEPNPEVTSCALNVTSLLLVLAVAGLQSVINFLISLIVNQAGRRNIVMVVTALCGVSGIVVNLVPNAIGSATLFAVFLIGIIVVGLYTAITVALFPTYLRASAVAVTMTGGRIFTFATIQIVNFLLANNCEIAFYIFATLYGLSAVVASFLPDDRLLIQKPPTPPSKNDTREISSL